MTYCPSYTYPSRKYPHITCAAYLLFCLHPSRQNVRNRTEVYNREETKVTWRGRKITAAVNAVSSEAHTLHKKVVTKAKIPANSGPLVNIKPNQDWKRNGSEWRTKTRLKYHWILGQNRAKDPVEDWTKTQVNNNKWLKQDTTSSDFTCTTTRGCVSHNHKGLRM